MQVCKHCKRDVGSRPVSYFDIESGITYVYHHDCFYGAVKRNVVDEYIDLVCRVAGHRRVAKK